MKPMKPMQPMQMDPFKQTNYMMQGITNESGGNDAYSSYHSTVYTYSSDGNGAPKVFQKTKEERRGPGGFKETKEEVKDSEAGIEKTVVGRHLGEKGHVIERSENLRSGEREEKQDFIGLEENDGPAFHEQWDRAARANGGGGGCGGRQRQQRQVEDRPKQR